MLIDGPATIESGQLRVSDEGTSKFIGRLDEFVVYNYILPTCAIAKHGQRGSLRQRYWDEDLTCVCMC